MKRVVDLSNMYDVEMSNIIRNIVSEFRTIKPDEIVFKSFEKNDYEKRDIYVFEDVEDRLEITLPFHIFIAIQYETNFDKLIALRKLFEKIYVFSQQGIFSLMLNTNEQDIDYFISLCLIVIVVEKLDDDVSFVKNEIDDGSILCAFNKIEKHCVFAYQENVLETFKDDAPNNSIVKFVLNLCSEYLMHRNLIKTKS